MQHPAERSGGIVSAFPLPVPPPVDRIWGNEVLQAHPEILAGDVIHNTVLYMQPRIKYYLAPGDANEWVSPRDVIAQGTGNCEDCALVALSVLSAAGVPGRLAFYFDPEAKVGHTTAYFTVSTCCETFYRVIECREGSGVQEWEAEDLSAFRQTFGYPEWEKV